MLLKRKKNCLVFSLLQKIKTHHQILEENKKQSLVKVWKFKHDGWERVLVRFSCVFYKSRACIVRGFLKRRKTLQFLNKIQQFWLQCLARDDLSWEENSGKYTDIAEVFNFIRGELLQGTTYYIKFLFLCVQWDPKSSEKLYIKVFESELLLLLLQIFLSRELAAKVNLLKGIENWSVVAQSVVY